MPLVLCYHAASEAWTHQLSLPPGRIARQVGWLLRAGYRSGSLGDLVARGGRRLHVTFDDAFRSCVRALPALEELGVPVTIFVCAGLAERRAGLEIAELEREPRAERTLMDWDELVELVERGIGVESHCLSHAHLPRLSDGDLRRELGESKALIEERLGRPCRFLAYPFGEVDERVRDAAAQAGYEAAFGVGGRDCRDPFRLPRVAVYRSDRPLDVVRKIVRGK